MTRPAPSYDALQAYADGFNKSLTLRYFGAIVDFPTPQLIRVTMPVKPEHRGGMGSDAVNGGILAAIFDLVIGCTAALIDPTRRSATMQLSMSFERGITGDSFTAEGWIDRAGGRTAFSSAVIKNAQGEVCARSQGVIRLTDMPWASGGSPAIN